VTPTPAFVPHLALHLHYTPWFNVGASLVLSMVGHWCRTALECRPTLVFAWFYTSTGVVLGSVSVPRWAWQFGCTTLVSHQCSLGSTLRLSLRMILHWRHSPHRCHACAALGPTLDRTLFHDGACSALGSTSARVLPRLNRFRHSLLVPQRCRTALNLCCA
jgi:hypothetical protein